jgi:CRP/FNR family cyclic AMP-dependent transcriptional regulator
MHQENFMKRATAKFLDRRVYFDGNVVFAEGERGDVMFLVESGKVRLARGELPSEIEIATVGPHQIFGEMALIDGSPRMAKATAVGQTTVIAVGPKEFEAKLEGIDDKTRSLVNFLIRYCRETLPYSERQQNAAQRKETKNDALARTALASSQAQDVAKIEVPFLAALLQVLIGYTRRRLPPEN